MSLIASLITLLSCVVSSIPANTIGIQSLESDLIDSAFSTRWEEAPQHYVRSNSFSPDYQTGGSINGDDYYENNDSFDYAARINTVESHYLDEYRSDFNGNFNRRYNCADYDYYSFSLLTDSHVSFDVSAATDEYVLQLLAISYSGVSNLSAVQDVLLVYEDDSNEYVKFFSFYLKAGTYYILLYSDSYCTEDYWCSCSVTKMERVDFISVADARINKRCDAALWISDLVYTNLPHFFYCGDDIKYYDRRINGIPNRRDIAFEDLADINGESPILLSEFYIWNKELIASLYSALSGLRSAQMTVVDTYVNSSSFQLDFNSFHVFFDQGAGVAKMICDLPIPFGSISITMIDIAESFIDLISSVLRILIPQLPSSISSYISYLDRLCNALFSALNVYEGTYILPFRFPCFYSVSGGSTSTHGSISYRPTYDYCLNVGDDSRFVYSDTNLFVSQNTSGHCGGSILLFRREEGATRMGLVNRFDDVLTINQLPLGFPLVTRLLIDSDYEWFSFRAPSSGVYSFLLSYDNDVFMEFFDHAEVGQNTTNVLSNAAYIFAEPMTGSSYLYHKIAMDAGESVFVRIRGNNWCNVRPGTIEVREGVLNPTTHISHSYDQHYVGVSDSKHKAYCECGAFALLTHVFTSSWYSGRVKYSECGLCGMIVQNANGFIGPSGEGNEYE